MPPSFRNRFRRRSPGPPSTRNYSSNSTGNGGGGGGGDRIKSFLERRSSSQSQHKNSPNHYNNNRPPLATFDACIEACDALAASSLSQQNQRQFSLGGSGGTNESGRICEHIDDNNVDTTQTTAQKHEEGTAAKETEGNHNIPIPECSVLVSPDGALLFTHHTANTDTETTTDRYPWTKISPEDRDGIILEEEYESAVIHGHDLTPLGDYDCNGFSARGWNHDAATVALAASRDVLTNMESLVEEVATCHKEEAACMTNAVAKFADFRSRLEKKSNQHKRMGPIISSGTNLSAAMDSLEDYYTSCSENALERWRMACSERCYSSTTSNLTMSNANASVELQELNNGEANDDDDGDSALKATNPESMIQGILPKLRNSSIKAKSRTSERERALSEIRSKISDAESILKKQKDWASKQHQRVNEEEANIDRSYAIRKMEQHEFYEAQRRRQDSAMLDELASEMEEPLSKEVWEMVQGVADSMDDFGHTGYSPRQLLRKPSVDDVVKQRFDGSGYAVNPDNPNPRQIVTPPKNITRADVEKESEINDLRMVAMAADEAVEDAAGKLLNIMSKSDTTLRSATLAAETCLLSECNAAYSTIRSLVAMERASLEERMRKLEVLESAVNAIDVRKDIDNYIKSDKSIPGGRSHAGEDDDGGIAAALAVLNSHGESSGSAADTPRKYRNVERPSHFSGWGDDGAADSDEEDKNDNIQPELFEELIKLLFGNESKTEDENKIEAASNALVERSKRGQSFRKSVLYELNNQRSKETQVKDKTNFDALCRIFNSFLSGCGSESVDVNNAKMLMILSQTFYYQDDDGGTAEVPTNDGSSTTKDRKSRIYVKSQIANHEIWSSDDFFDQAVFQCVSESLQKSGVLLNYAKLSLPDGENRAARDPKSIKWHDLEADEYAGAASQVHSIVFAQLGTLSHSMLELGCGIPRAVNFVRRLAIRYQLPLSLRITLIQHLTKKRS